jgi:hypothetical protein
MKLYLLLFLFFITGKSIAQIKISGRLVDEKTHEPIQGASVYLNNSSCGTDTDADGKFVLTCAISGKAEIVFSHVVYEKKIQIIENRKGENLIISLKSQSNNLNEVIIKTKANSKADLTRWINLFSENLIGLYGHSRTSCRLKNPEVLYFNFDKSENLLKVYAKAPLIIENLYLAYSIRLDLDIFEYSFNNNEVIFKYSSLYKNFKLSKLSEQQIKDNRKAAYEGSSTHFMRSVFTNSVAQEGFQVFKYKAIQNMERKRVQGIVWEEMAKAYVEQEHPNVALNHLFSRDTSLYYMSILRQSIMTKFKTKPINIIKLTTEDKRTRTVNLNFQDTILVSYQKPAPKEIIPEHKAVGSEVIIMKKKPEVSLKPALSSYLYFFENGGINIESTGFYGELSLFMYGDMADRRLGYAVPLDFDPDFPYLQNVMLN